jgi:TolA-binding protein
MKCRQAEKRLYLLSENPSDPMIDSDLREHLCSCKRCRRLLEILQMMDGMMSEAPNFTAIPSIEIDRMVSARIKGHSPIIRKRSRDGVFKPRIAWAIAVSLTVASMILILSIISFRDKIFHTHQIAVDGAPRQFRSIMPSADSTISLGENCAIRLHKGGRYTIVRAEERVAFIDICYGRVSIAAVKGMYDTIAIQSGGVRVFATGTHFEADGADNIIRVSVLEGNVMAYYPLGKEIPVKALETWTFNIKANTSLKENLSLEKQQMMIDDFAAMAAVNMRIGLNKAVSGKNIPLAARRGRSPASCVPKQNQPAASERAARQRYAIAGKMLQNGSYASAAIVLEDYLKKYDFNADSAWFNLAFCYTNQQRYHKAVTAYRRVVDSGIDERLIESALHRYNKILYLKLKEYDNARCGIETYLEKYPLGRWRREELYYYVRLAFSQGNMATADSLRKVFTNEFPGDCRAQELLEGVAALKH